MLKIFPIRKDTSMPIRAGVFFSMFPFCILFEVKHKIYHNLTKTE